MLVEVLLPAYPFTHLPIREPWMYYDSNVIGWTTGPTGSPGKWGDRRRGSVISNPTLTLIMTATAYSQSINTAITILLCYLMLFK